ncbi:MAG TPA: hypothetical protein VLF09_01260 [Cellvibrio sp.]|nr:hypothetical protein [Cellvibrio sp.]
MRLTTLKMPNRIVPVAALFTALMSNPIIAKSITNDWQFSATAYGWFPDIGGETSFRLDGTDAINVDIDTILDNLEMTAQGTFEARKGNWGAMIDFVYLDVGASDSRTRNIELGGQPLPGSVTTAGDFDLKSLFVTFAGTYQLVDNPGLASDLLFGARVASLDQTFSWKFTGDFGSITPPPRTGAREASDDQVDVIVGAKGRWALGAERKWVIPFHIDIGAGDSDLTFQAMVGLGYTFEWGDFGAAWRYLDYDMKVGGAIAGIDFNGPALGATFRW